VKVAFRERDPRILPEMSAKVAFLSREPGPGEQAPLRAVPAAAVAQGNGPPRVFLIQGDRVREVPVQLGRRLGEMVELQEGPAIGSRIATAPLDKLTDGARVSIPKQ
jgi:multidrug efflux pump subunit AcrA (membrane-fusion protein)